MQLKLSRVFSGAICPEGLSQWAWQWAEQAVPFGAHPGGGIWRHSIKRKEHPITFLLTVQFKFSVFSASVRRPCQVEKAVRRESDKKPVLNPTSYETKQDTCSPWVSVRTNKGYGVDQGFQICPVASGFSIYTLGHIPRGRGKSIKGVGAKRVCVSPPDPM